MFTNRLIKKEKTNLRKSQESRNSSPLMKDNSSDSSPRRLQNKPAKISSAQQDLTKSVGSLGQINPHAAKHKKHHLKRNKSGSQLIVSERNPFSENSSPSRKGRRKNSNLSGTANVHNIYSNQKKKQQAIEVPPPKPITVSRLELQQQQQKNDNLMGFLGKGQRGRHSSMHQNMQKFVGVGRFIENNEEGSFVGVDDSGVGDSMRRYKTGGNLRRDFEDISESREFGEILYQKRGNFGLYI